MALLTGTIGRISILIGLTVVPFALSGGPTHQLWQPFALLMVIGTFLACYYAYNGLEPLSAGNLSKSRIRITGLAGVRLSIFLCVFFASLRALYYLDLPAHRIIELIVNDIVGVWYATIVYLAVFAPHTQQRVRQKIPSQDEWSKAKSHIKNGLALVGLIFLVFMAYIVITDSLWPKYSAAHFAAWQARDSGLKSEESAFAKKYCNAMSEEQRKERYLKIEAEEYEKRGLASERFSKGSTPKID